jgi:hypothetical protein
MIGDDQSALEELTKVMQGLSNQVATVASELVKERDERHEDQQRIKDVGRRVFAAVVIAMVLLCVAGAVAVYAVNERATELCEQTNESRRGNRNSSRIMIDKLFGLAGASQNPHNPVTAEQVEALRVQVQAEIRAELDTTQPILDC